MVGTTRKFLRAPRGTAAYWLSPRAERVLGAAPSDMEPLDLSPVLLAGLTTAADLAQQTGIAAVANQLARLTDLLADGLRARGFTLHGLGGAAGTVSCSVAMDDYAELDRRLAAMPVIAKWCDVVADEPYGHAKQSCARLRLSPHVYNGETQLTEFLNTVF